MKIKGIIFDFDGTLFDSMWVWLDIPEKYLNSIGKEAKPDLLEVLHRMCLREAAEYLKKQYEIEQTVDEIISGINEIVKDYYYYQVKPKAGLEEFLKALKDKGIKMCIATASEYDHVKTALNRCGISEYFEDILTCEIVGFGKDKPDIYIQSAKLLKTEASQTLVVEDALHGALTAKNAGFKIAGIYDKSEPQYLMLKQKADIWLEDFTDTTAFWQYLN